MKLTLLYKIYRMIGQGPLRYYGTRIMETLGVRHKVVRMDLRLLCNLRCPTCVYSKESREAYQMDQMSLKDFETIAADLFPSTLVLALACQAEPFMVKDFDRYLDVVGKYRIPTVTVPTNGTLLSDKYIDALIRNNITEVTISMDGATKETFERFRAGANFERVIDNIRRLIKRKSELGRAKPEIRFNFTMNRDNISEICAFIELAKSLGGSTIMFRHFTDWGGELDFDKYSLSGSHELYNQEYYKARKLADQSGMEVLLPLPFKTGGGDEAAAARDKEATDSDIKLKKYGCVNPWFYVYIRPDGAYRPCTYLDFEGDLINQSFAEYQKTPVPSERKRRLLRDLEHSCMHDTCRGRIMGRVNDDSNVFSGS